MRVNRISFNSSIFDTKAKRENLYKSPVNDSYSHISFLGGTGADGNRMRKRLGGMNCPCCGIKMLTQRDIKMALANPPDAPSSDVIPILKRYEDQMHSVERDALYTLKVLSKENPNCNLRLLLDIVRDEHLAFLRDDEFRIIERIKCVGAFLSPDSKDKLEKTIQEAEDEILDGDYDSAFKRRAFIGKIGDVISTLPEKDAALTIFEIAHEMPRAGDNISAFVVKFSEKNPATGLERNSHDIIRALMVPSLATVEHVRARSPLAKNGGGVNLMKNYIIECLRDNNMRDCMPFRDFVKKNPQFFGDNIQKYIDVIIERLNRGELRGFELYPLQISRTLRRQTKGIIKLDISSLRTMQPYQDNYKFSR